MRTIDPELVQVAVSCARRFGASREDAEDIAQEALFKLLIYIDRVEDPVAWLYVVTRRLYRRLATPARMTVATVEEGLDPRPYLDLSIDTRRLAARLSVRRQMSLRLAAVGYTERETAERLGCTAKASERALHQARRQIRRGLAGS
jgi:DNA-directed RNA polymerase specialized sigma24 family protein